jgi:CRISPR type III-B/RAMP module-associated protein Cmr3
MAQRGYIRITPLDGLFFGKGRPFNMGDDTWTDADLLPQPGVVWGAIFSQLWYRDENTPLDALKIGRIILMGENLSQLYLPAPLDMFETEDGKRYHHKFYWQEDEKYIHWAKGKNVLLKPETDEIVEPSEQMLISVSSLRNYLGPDREFSVKTEAIETYIKTEFKIGISRDPVLRVADEGLLYTVQLAQFKYGYSLIVEAEYPDKLPVEGILKIGGEGKMARFEAWSEQSEKGQSLKNALAVPPQEDEVGFFKIYLTTPAQLNQDGLPAFLDGKPFSIEAGVTGKPYLSGGFDLKAGRPKPKAMLTPAGSIYILEYTGDGGRCTAQKAKELIGQELNTQGINQFEITSYYGDKDQEH